MSTVTVEDMNQMLAHQNELNTMILGGNWVKGDERFDTAVATEVGELLDSIDWKWWKSGENDMKNVLMEATDVVFFTVSLLIREFASHDEPLDVTDNRHFAEVNLLLESTIEHMSIQKRLIQIQDESMRIYRHLTTLAHTNKDIGLFSIINSALRIVILAGFTPGDLVKTYYGKLMLNIFRQKNGYKDGTYRKIWDDDGNEDNVYLQEYLDSFENASDINLTDTYDYLENQYSALGI